MSLHTDLHELDTPLQDIISDTMINTSPQALWRYGFFNLILLALLGTWFWLQNQPVALIEPALPADGKLQCISYSPYYGKDQTPLKPSTVISKAQIDQDLRLLAQRADCVRIYSVSQGLDYVPEAASRLGIKVLLGAWIGWVPANNEKELKLAISLAKQHPDTIKGLIIGNEVLLRGEQTEATLRSYIERAKQEAKVPVSYADVWEYWIKHKDLEKSVDFVTVHVLPYWEDDPQSIDNAIPHANNVMGKLASIFKKPVLIGETGWPSTGRQRDKAIPGQLNQARYIREFLQVAHDKNWNYNVIEAVDQPWKRALEGTVGGYWGLYTTDLTPKFGFTGMVSERHDGWPPVYIGLLGAFIVIGLSLLLGERRTSVLFGMAGLGALLGASGILQINALDSACGDGSLWLALTCVPAAGRALPKVMLFLEWLFFGGAVIAGWIALLGFPWLFTKPSSKALNIVQLSLFILVIGAATAGWLIITDGRYRDFPISIYALPALELSIGLVIAGISIRPVWRVFYLVNAIVIICAAVCYWKEPNNINAALWLGLTVLIAFASWPKTRLHPLRTTN